MAEDTDNRLPERERRRQEKTASGTPGPFVPERPPIRPTAPCEPPEEIPPQEFLSPEGCPPPPRVPDALPDPLVVRNAGIVLSCSDIPSGPPEGDDVHIPAGTVEERVYFQAIPRTSKAQLTFIAGLPPDVVNLLLEDTTSVQDIRQMFNLDLQQAGWLKAARDQAVETVKEREMALARNSLRCLWYNQPYTAECPPGALRDDDPPEGQESAIRNPVSVPAGTYSSDVSQEDADLKAQTAAQSALRCLWGNSEQSADCVTDMNKSEAVPVDEELVGSATRLRVGYAVVPANTFFSDVSQADADAMAKVAAVGALDCFYINSPVSAACDPDEDGVPAEVHPKPSGETASSGVAGNPVTVPLGFLESPNTTAEANGQALALAQSLLYCYWINDEQTAECPVRLVGSVEYEPSPTSPIPSATVPAGEVISFESKAAANREALDRAVLSLDCFYCNKRVEPKCVPDDFIVTDLPIPLSEIDSSWSLTATRGAPEGMFCTPDPEESQSIAEALGSVPVPVVDPILDCVFGNDPIEASCWGRPEDGVRLSQPIADLPSRGGPCVSGATGTAEGEYILDGDLALSGDTIKVALFDEEQGLQLSSLSYPNPFAADESRRKITIARNTVTVQQEFVPAGYRPSDPDRAKKYANELAAGMALSSLDCFFANCAGKYRCHGRIAENERNFPFVGKDSDGVSLFGTGYMTSPLDGMDYEVSPRSLGHKDNPLHIPEAQFTSRVSKAEVDIALQTYLLSALNCHWSHGDITALCGSFLITQPNGYDYTYVAGTGVMGYEPGSGMTVLYRNGQEGFSTLIVPPGKYVSFGGGPPTLSDTKPIGSGWIYVQDNGDEGHMVAEESKGHPSDPVYVAADLFPSNIHPNIPWIQAYQLALGQLNCYFKNTLRTAACVTDSDDAPTGLPVNQIPTAGSVPSASVPAGQYFSSFSQRHADLQAQTAANAMLFCMWDSMQVQGIKSCPPGSIPSGEVILEQGAFSHPKGSWAATEAAQKMANGMVVCMTLPEQGPAGNDGAQTNCSGNCYGYYS